MTGVQTCALPISFLGEAPGQDEDKSGRPFIGRAGKVLDSFLASCNLNREDVYILNICKCRPPSNRAPLIEEANNCRPFLELQLQVLKPKFIICLGATASQNLLKTEEKISALRGQIFKCDIEGVDAKVICTYHPAYVLRNPAAKGKVWDDLKVFLEELEKDTSQTTEINI